MSVSGRRPSTSKHQCVICRKTFDAAPSRKALYCGSACMQKAYRRRQAEKRHNEAIARRKRDEHDHREAWVKVLVAASCSRRQAERTYEALMSLNRLHGFPWDQLTLF